MNFIGTILYSYMSQDEIENVMNQDGSWDKESVRAAVECIADWLDKGYFPYIRKLTEIRNNYILPEIQHFGLQETGK